jgi:WD40 repeat protein
LAHDRLIAPIQQDNARWFAAKLSPLQRQAALWAAQERPAGLLLRDRPLAEAEAWARAHAPDMTEVEQDFLTASRAAEQAARRERRNNRLIRALAVLATLIMLAAIYFAVQAQIAAEQARSAQAQAVMQAQIAKSRQLAAQAYALLDSQPDLSLLLSIVAERTYDTVEAQGSLLTTLQQSAPLTTFLRGHSAEVLTVAFSPDGQTFASAGCGDKTGCDQQEILQWSTTQLRPIGAPIVITGPVISSLTYTSDGQHLVIANHAREVTFWNLAQQRANGTLDAGTLDAEDTAWSVAASPVSDTVAVGTDKGSILLFEPSQGQTPRRILQLHRDRVLSLAFSADGTLLASGSGDRTAIIWDVRTGTPRYPPLVGHAAPVAAVAFAPGGTILASGGQDDQVRLWDLRGAAPASRALAGHARPVTSLAFGEGGRILASASRDMTIRLWDPLAGRTTATLAAHQAAVTGLAFNRDGRTLVAASEDNTLSFWDVTRRQRLGTPLLTPAAPITSLDIAADGAAAAWSDQAGQIVFADLAASPPISRTLPAPGDVPVSRLALSADGSRLAFGGTDGTLWLSGSPPTAPPVRLAPRLDDAVSALTYSPDGTLLAAASCARPPEGVCRHSRLLVLAVPSGEVRQDLSAHAAEIAALAFSPDGRVLASAAREMAGTTLLWGLDSGLQMRATLQGQSDWVVSLAFNHAGSNLATGSRDRSVFVWDAATGTRPSLPLLYREGYPTSLVFSPDTRILAAGDSLGRVALWDWTSAQQVGPPLTLDSQRILDLNYASSPAGSWLVAGDTAAGLITWDVAVKSWEAQACAIANRQLTAAEWDRYLGREVAYRPICP